jgi:hypothetical protein
MMHWIKLPTSAAIWPTRGYSAGFDALPRCSPPWWLYITACIQPLCIADASGHVDAYLKLWFSAGGLCLAVVACGMVIRYRRSESPLDRELSVQAVYQFLPCLLVGGLFTYVLASTAWHTMWILPGAWEIFFGMGILACRQLLPRGTAFVGGFYLFCGLLAISLAKKEFLFSPLLMGIPFGAGQAMAAAILYWKLERNRAESTSQPQETPNP